MPRIRPRDIIKARTTSDALFALLPVCRSLASARNELRWLMQHAAAVSKQSGHVQHSEILPNLISRRARGEPLQYIVGTEWFGDLELKVRSGVLIPRQETAAAVSYLAELMTARRDSLDEEPRHLRHLDLCTGTGCIPLLLHHIYYGSEQASKDRLEIVGVDISGLALSLARENLIHRIATHSQTTSASQGRTRSLHGIGFVQADVLKPSSPAPTNENKGTPEGPLPLLEALRRLHDNNDSKCAFNLLTANPPYISPKSFKRTTSRSVRDFEPLQALVPPTTEASTSDTEIGDLFYTELLRAAEEVEAEAFLFEVADMDQAMRVVLKAVAQGRWERLEVWRDEPGAKAAEEQIEIWNQQVRVRGMGHGRSVFGYRAGAKQWLAV